MHTAIVSVVPTYRPDPRVNDLIDVLRAHGPVVVSDDASPCTSDTLLKTLIDVPNVIVIRHTRNRGIARGLNDGLRTALALGATWLLTVDQDSQLPPDYPAQLAEFANMTRHRAPAVAAIGSAHVTDGSSGIRYPTDMIEGIATTPEIIQTGSLWRVEPLLEVGGFDETFGIDAVDAAACVRLRRLGYVVALAPDLSIDHQIGSSLSLGVLGRNIMITRHSPERRTTMMRNRLRLFPEEFQESPRHALRSIRRVIVNQTIGLFMEGQRREKALGTLRGFKSKQTDILET